MDNPAAAATVAAPFTGLADRLIEQGWCLLENHLDTVLVEGLRQEAEALLGDQRFRPAAIGRGPQQRRRADIRSDRICWLDFDTPVQQAYRCLLETMAETLRRELWLPLRSFEGHFACYPVGSFYSKHLDSHRGGSARLVSVVTYLNREWTAEDAGELRVYPPEPESEAQAILPLGGRTVVMLSDRVPHAVSPGHRRRLSLTGWFRSDDREPLLAPAG